MCSFECCNLDEIYLFWSCEGNTGCDRVENNKVENTLSLDDLDQFDLTFCDVHNEIILEFLDVV